MPAWTRSITLLLTIAAFLATTAAAFAATSDVLALTEAETETTEAPAVESGVVPAVEAPDAGEGEEEQPWTARFLAPAVLTIGIVAIVVSAIAYATRVRGRYRVVG
jgi:hypothetical protein